MKEQKTNSILWRLYIRAKGNNSEYIDDIPEFKSNIERYINKGWRDDDIFEYLSYSEEVSPCYSEKFALEKMGEIAKKYK